LIRETRYRLDQLMIIEHGGVLLTWVSHLALGSQRGGKCFVIGNILVIGPCDHEEAGYLKLEYHEHLKNLPAWNKTRYYCLASDIRDVDTEQTLTSYLMERLSIDNIDMKAASSRGPKTFRLGRYEITVDKDNIISWKTVAELNRTIIGTCFKESGILFLGPAKYESDKGQGKQTFLKGLKLLPRWDRTLAWGHQGSLKVCKEPEPGKSRAAAWNPQYVKTFIKDKVPFSRGKQYQKKTLSQFMASCLEQLKGTRHRIVRWKGWGSVMPLIMTGVHSGFRVLIFVMGYIARLSVRVIERLRKKDNQ
jgi:hypothetical protein